MGKMNILIVDDEKEIADLVELYLLNENYTVYKFYHPKQAWKCIQEVPLDLAILDVMMPDINGFELCKMIRQEYSFPIIMLTAKVEDMDKILGLTIGSDDYITKPFNPLEMIARVKAQLRRFTRYNQQIPTNKNIIDFSGLIINRDTHTCIYHDKEIFLTPTEFSILWILCENRGQVISAERLFEAVWKEKYFNSNNTVMVHIRHLREKMQAVCGTSKLIQTVWGVGYKVE